MSFKAKKVLLILQLNQCLLYVNNLNSKYVDLSLQNNKVFYHDQFENYQLSYRKGRGQFIQYVMNTEKHKIDVAVWSNLSNSETEGITKKYFGRYYRNLLFILATNRQLYAHNNSEECISIRRDLQNVYRRFSGYQQTNTLMISCSNNLIQKYKRNDLIIPRYHPSSRNFNSDAGMYALMKYIKGLIDLQKQGNIQDIRILTQGKQINNIFQRYSHTMYTETQYL